MSTTVHHLHKDVRRHALWLTVWAVLCVLPLTVLAIPPSAMMAYVALNTLAAALRLVGFVLLAVLVVHEDPLVGSTAFWVTRPVGWRALFASKLLFVGVLLVLPVVAVDVAQVASTGISGAYVTLAVPEIALDWILWATAAVTLASLTGTVPGFLGAILKVAVVALLAGPLVGLWRMPGQLGSMPLLGFPLVESQLDPWREAPSMLASRTLATSALLAVVALAVAALQFRTRRVRRAWATLVVGLVGVMMLRTVWRWDLLGLPRAEARIDATLRENVQLTIEPTGRLESTSTGGGGENQTTVYARARVAGSEPPLAAEIERIDGWLTFGDGSRSPLGGRDGKPFEARWNATALEALLGGAHFVNLDQEGAGRVLVLRLDTSEYKRHAGTSGGLSGNATLTLRAYRVAAELPVRPGAAYDDGVQRAVIAAVQNASGDCSVIVHEPQVSLLLAPNPHAYRSMLFFRFNPDVLYVLRNRERGEAFWPQLGVTGGFGWPARSRIEDITAVPTYRSNIPSSPPLPRLDEAWMAGADLVRIEAESKGTVTARIETPSFVLPSDGDPPR